MKTQNIQLSKLENNTGQVKGLPKNPRLIKDDRYRKLVKSIQDLPEMLELRELLVYPFGKKYVIIGGNMRFKALSELKFTEAPCKVIDANISLEKLKEIAIKDNVGFGADDWGLLADEWNVGKLADWGMEIPEFKNNIQAEDDNFEIPNPGVIKKSIKLGDVIEIGNHRLVCGDSTKEADVKLLMNGKQADCVVTDPPYNVDYVGKTKKALKIENDKMGDEPFYQFLLAVYKNLFQAMRPGAPIYVFHPDIEVLNFVGAFKKVDFKMHQILIWLKNSMVMGRKDYHSKHEPILYGWKEGAGHKWYSDRKQTTILEFDRPSRNAEHPTMKPVKLIAYLIANSAKKGDIVLDLFGGGGSTMVACEQLGCISYNAELDPKYCQVIIDRMQNLTPSIVVKVNGKPYKSLHKK